MSFTFLSPGVLLEPPVWRKGEVPEELSSYEERMKDSVLMVEPNGYAVESGRRGVEIRTPVYARLEEPARQLRVSVRNLTTSDLHEDLHDPADFAFVSGRTAPCCGRVSHVAVADGRGRVIFDRAMAPHNGERCEDRGVDPLWSCAERHQYYWAGRGAADAPFSHWARELSNVLRYSNRRDSGTAKRGGRKRIFLVVWGPEFLQALHREFAYAHGHPRNGRIQQVKDALDSLWLCDLRLADLMWRGTEYEGAAGLAHLDGATAVEDCGLMHEHLQRMLADNSRDRGAREPVFRTGAPEPFVVAGPPTAETLGGREGWKFTKGVFVKTADGPKVSPSPPLPGEELQLDPEELRQAVPDMDLDGATDVIREVRTRREQGRLRQYLFGGKKADRCDLCGRTLPCGLLKVAHIKRRADASEAERRDPAIIMSACDLGCDRLFELGYVYVGRDGEVRVPQTAVEGPADLMDAAERLAGRRCTAHDSASEVYFQAHRDRFGYPAE